MVTLMIKRSELLLDDRTNQTGLGLPAVSHFLVMRHILVCISSLSVLQAFARVWTAAHDS